MAEPRDIVVNFEGKFTKKQKERISKFVRNNIALTNDQVEIRKMITEYQNSRDFILVVLNPNQINCVLKDNRQIGL